VEIDEETIKAREAKFGGVPLPAEVAQPDVEKSNAEPVSLACERR
jgi:hypothetical protein